MNKRFITLSLILLSAFLYTGCIQKTEKQEPPAASDTTGMMNNNQPDIIKAVAVLHATKGNNVSGIVTFTKEGSQIKVVADISGLTPGMHGFHIHQYGDCSAEDGSSAGGHFNPDNVNHGGPADSVRHAGDLGNVKADQNGNVHFEMINSLLSFSGPHSIIGRGVIVHAGEDDLTSQPSGNAGARVACGDIGIAKP